MNPENFAVLVKNEKVINIIVVESNSSFLTKNPEWIFIGENPQKIQIGWSYVNEVFNPPPPLPPPPPIITKVAMISRFTPEEYVGIVGATKTDVEVQAWYDLFQASSKVDLSDQRTVSGINSFVAKGLLTQARADEILNAEVQPGER